MPRKFIELFSGIGGLACAAKAAGARILAAWDQDRTACAVYARNLGLAPAPKNITGLTSGELARHSGAGWLLSPPCQPYTVKGRQRDDSDPRSLPLLHLARIMPEARPASLLLENVPPFSRSRCRDLLLAALDRCGLHVSEVILCPTMLGIPNRRRRYYLLASPRPLPPMPPLPDLGRPLADYLLPAPPPELLLSDRDRCRIHPEHPVIRVPAAAGHDADAPRQVAACFGSSYGRVLRKAGSFVEVPGPADTGLRRFAPEEILALLHFPPGFAFPPHTSLGDRYRLAGNSVNVAVVTHLLRWLPNTEREEHA